MAGAIAVICSVEIAPTRTMRGASPSQATTVLAGPGSNWPAEKIAATSLSVKFNSAGSLIAGLPERAADATAIGP